MSHFPIILIPHAIEQVRLAQPPVPSPPQPPQTLVIKEPKKLSISELVILTIVWVIAVPIITKITSIPGLFVLLAVVGMLAYYAWDQTSTYPQRKLEHRDKVGKYSIEQQHYTQRQRDYEREVQLSRSPQRIAEFQYKLLLDALRDTIPHDGDDSRAQQGQAEAQFNSHLNRYFPGKVHRRLTLIIPDFEYPYSPDFAYIDSTLNLYIDIEIDEPYVYHTGEPTHFQEAWKDDKRNRFFLRKGWVIIRFSEEQVVCYPHSCCKFIANAIFKITGDNSSSKQFFDTSNIQQISQWTEHEATVMAQRKARNNYRCQNDFDLLIPVNEKQTSNSDLSKLNNTLPQVKTSKTSIQNKKKKLRHKFTRYLGSQPTGINIENSKKTFLNYLEEQPTVLGEWVKNNRFKAELFLKYWNH